MRDRLIELIRKGILKYTLELMTANIKYVKGILEEEIIADYLLENGVIVPPCKVGDTVYSIRGFDGKLEQCEPYTVTDITIYENTIAIHIMDEWLFVRNMYPADIGKTIFLTREEAEAKLKGGAE